MSTDYGSILHRPHPDRPQTLSSGINMRHTVHNHPSSAHRLCCHVGALIHCFLHAGYRALAGFCGNGTAMLRGAALMQFSVATKGPTPLTGYGLLSRMACRDRLLPTSSNGWPVTLQRAGFVADGCGRS